MNMVSKCGPQILACVSDPTCKAALDCLQACDPTDQARFLRPVLISCFVPCNQRRNGDGTRAVFSRLCQHVAVPPGVLLSVHRLE